VPQFEKSLLGLHGTCGVGAHLKRVNTVHEALLGTRQTSGKLVLRMGTTHRHAPRTV